MSLIPGPKQIPSNPSYTPTFSSIENLLDLLHRKACMHKLAFHIVAFEAIVSTIQGVLIEIASKPPPL